MRRPDVIVVDQADRRPPGELLNLLASAPDARLVFVEGGTTLRSPRDASLGYARVSSAAARVDPGPEPVWRPEDSPERAGPGAVAGALLSRWADRTDSLLVGLGTAEALALNAAARRHLASEGRIGGPSVSSRGREFAAGDTVIAVRPVGAGLAAGSRGSVLEVDERRARAVVEWSGRRTDLGRAELARVGHGYAATPRLAAKSRGPLLVLGEAAGLGLDRSRVAAEMRVDLRSPALERGRGLGID